MKIHMIVPYFSAAEWATACLRELMVRAQGIVHVTIVDMDTKHPFDFTGNDYHQIVRFNPKDMIGGHPLPFALSLGMNQHRDADITVTVDTDALVLKHGWDDELRRLFTDPKLMCAGINPRSDTDIFSDCPEWNWMAFRTEFWHREVSTFLPKNEAGPDIGHLFRHAAQRCKKKYKVWPMQSRPFTDKGATFVGDSPDDLWAFHAFYSSRRVQDSIPDAERKWMLTPEQEASLRLQCRDYKRKEEHAAQ